MQYTLDSSPLIRRTVWGGGGLILCLILTSCSSDPNASPPASASQTELGLSAAVSTSSDVEKMRYTVSRCGGNRVQREMRDLASSSFPGNLETFHRRPYDPDSKHRFSDMFVMLDAGCYTVRVEPLRDDGTPSPKCAPAAKQAHVTDGGTTEIVLISQCEGDERGGLDVAGTINHEPEIRDITYTPSKFVPCAEEAQVCIEATDADNEPLRVEFGIEKGPTPRTSPKLSTPVDEKGRIVSCLSFMPGQGDWQLKYRVWDRVWFQNQLIDIETYIENYQHGSHHSHDTMYLPLRGEACEQRDTGVRDAGEDVAPQPDVSRPDTRDVEPPQDVPRPDARVVTMPRDVPPEPDTSRPDTIRHDTSPEPDTSRPDAPSRDPFCTQTQGGYGGTCPRPNPADNPSCARDRLFAADFPSGLTIGDFDGPDGDSEFAARWTSASAIASFLPAGGMPATLNADATDPSATSAAVFAGQLVSAKLSLAFSDDRSGRAMDALVYQEACGGNNPFVGSTIGNIVEMCDAVISGASSIATPSACNTALDAFNNTFVDCQRRTDCYELEGVEP